MAVLPSKVLPTTVTSISAYAQWPSNDGPGNITTGKDYQWTLVLDIPTSLQHSSHETPTPFLYNGLDIKVGDFIATSNDGKYVKIINIISQSTQACTCVVEDEDRLNTFQDNTGNADGSIPIQVEGFIFEMRNGAPILYPLPPGLLDVFPNIGAQIVSRFLFRSKAGTQTITQSVGGPFNVGDAVYLASSGQWGKVDITQTGHNFIGVVIETGVPGPNSFTVKTVGPIIENLSLPGNLGDFLYLDPSSPGSLTTTPAELYAGNNAIFIKLDATRGILISGALGSATGAASKIYVVTSIAERDSINNPAEGSLAYVKNTGGGQGAAEWTIYIYLTGIGWSELTNQDAALVDAGSAQIEITNTTGSSTIPLKIVSTQSRPFAVSVDVTIAFNAETTVKVGDANDDDRFMTVDENDLSVIGTYLSTPAFCYDTITENTVTVTIENANNPTVGEAKVLMSYV